MKAVGQEPSSDAIVVTNVHTPGYVWSCGDSCLLGNWEGAEMGDSSSGTHLSASPLRSLSTPRTADLDVFECLRITGICPPLSDLLPFTPL